jgi:hypothetical protein
LFGWALNHYAEALPVHCCSLKTFVHVHHTISRPILQALGKVEGAKEVGKLAKELREKLEEKFELLGVNMLNFVFGRAKLYFLQ